MGNLYIGRCKTSEEQKMLMYEGLRMYNALPVEIRKEGRLQSFRKELARYIKAKERGIA